MITAMLCYSATSSSSVAEYGTPCRVDMGNVGLVEVDETYMGGKAKNMHQAKRERLGGRGTAGKQPVFGMVERKGKVIAKVVPDVSRETLLPNIREKVLPSSLVYSDEHASYDPLKSMGYQHRRVHHGAKVYVVGDVHTNTIEGFWSLVKRGISGVNHAVSAKYLQGYFDSYAFRWNHRDDDGAMYDSMANRVNKVRYGSYGAYNPIG